MLCIHKNRITFFQFIPKLNYATTEDIDKILGNKPARAPMISTLQSRWATTGGVPVPPC